MAINNKIINVRGGNMNKKYQLLQLIQVLYEDIFDERMPYQTYLLYKRMSLKALSGRYNSEILLRGKK
jgi:hypothetical protein